MTAKELDERILKSAGWRLEPPEDEFSHWIAPNGSVALLEPPIDLPILVAAMDATFRDWSIRSFVEVSVRKYQPRIGVMYEPVRTDMAEALREALRGHWEAGGD